MNHTIKNAERTEKRRFGKSLGNDLLKYIAEIITNSDDSYKRLEQDGVLDAESIKPVYIDVVNKRNKKEVIIIDNAEGMNDQDILNNFGEYGADTSGGAKGKKVRGLFGQGATDVLFSASMDSKVAEIKSFKDGELYTCKFKWDKADKVMSPIKSKKSKAQIRELRKHYRIPNNGTAVIFGLPKNVSIPRSLPESISGFYMLRYLLNKENREFVLTEYGSSKKISKLEYKFPPTNEEDQLASESIDFNFEGKKINGEFVILKKGQEREGEELKILVFDDEGNVYDNTLFGYEKSPSSNEIHGYLKMTGSTELIREKLNQKNPEEILTETRDGFNKKHDFYKELEKIIDPIIDEVITKISKDKKEKAVELTQQKEWKAAFKEINKYIEDELDEEIGGVDEGQRPPSDGLRFVNTNINITVGKKYSTKILINPKLIQFGSTITIKSDGERIQFSPSKIKVNEEDVDDNGLIVKSISVTSLEIGAKEVITASYENYSAKLFIEVIDKNIHYPRYGLEFWPSNVSINLDSTSKAKLFIDTDKFNIGSTIKLITINDLVFTNVSSLIIKEEDIIAGKIALIEITYNSLNEEGTSSITAEIGNSSTELSIKVSKNAEDDEDRGSGGFLAGLKSIAAEGQHWQTYYSNKDGYININTKNNINKLHLGEISEPFRPKKEQRKYLSELCAQETAKQLVKIKIEKGKIEYSDYEEVLEEIQKEKNTLLGIFVKILDSFIV